MLRRHLAIALTALTMSVPLAAQGLVADTTARPVASVDAPLPVATTSSAVRRDAAPLDLAPITAATTRAALAPPQASGQSNAMMVVGGIGMIAGALIGGKAGTIIMIGGAGLGLLGLWDHMK